jgi:D-3-phosphoglycerate dehydrogenase
MINATQLNKMKKGVVLINVARGPVVDEAALVEALESGRVRVTCLVTCNISTG